MPNFLQPKLILKITAICILFYILSFLAYLFPILNSIIFWVIIIGTFALAIKKLEYGVFIVLTELFIGVKGYLFSFDFGGRFVLSIRIALFAMVFLIWLIKKAKTFEAGKYNFLYSKFFIPFSILTIFILIGFSTGLVNGNFAKNIFFDANGYFYLAFIFPIFDIIHNKLKVRKLIQYLVAGSIAISILTFYVSIGFTIMHQEARPGMAGAKSTEQTLESEEAGEFMISHSIFAKEELLSRAFFRNLDTPKPYIYRWTQDTGMGEISYLTGPFFRFFSAGQLYSALVFIFLLAKFLQNKKIELKNNIFQLIVAAFCGLAVITGFSRSLWIGVVFALIFLLFNISKKRALKIALYGIGIISIIIIIFGTLLPQIYDLVGNRVGSIFQPKTEAAASNRYNVLTPAFEKIKQHPILGSGFGTTIEYTSVAFEKYGTVRVFSFEWAYLDTIIEIGILGLLAYIWFLYSIFKDGYKTKEPDNKKLVICFLAGIVLILFTNITTPFLNHPLGIGFVLITAATIFALEKIKGQTILNLKS